MRDERVLAGHARWSADAWGCAEPTAAGRAAGLSGASSVEDVGKWLAGEGVAPDVVGNFERERVDGAALQRLSAADLARMGVTKLGPKKALLQKIRDLAAGAGGGQTEHYAGARCGCATGACGLRGRGWGARARRKVGAPSLRRETRHGRAFMCIIMYIYI